MTLKKYSCDFLKKIKKPRVLGDFELRNPENTLFWAILGDFEIRKSSTASDLCFLNAIHSPHPVWEGPGLLQRPHGEARARTAGLNFYTLSKPLSAPL